MAKLDLAGLQKELLQIAEKEAKKKPNIRKNQLKKKIREQVLPSEGVAKILPDGMTKTIDAAIDAVVEMAITMARLRMEPPAGRGRPKKGKKAAKKKRGKTLAAMVEEIMEKKGVRQMRVVDIKKEVLKRKGYKEKEKKLYTLITIALNQSKKFEKVGPGEYKLAK